MPDNPLPGYQRQFGIKAKVEHVRRSEQTRKHACHWPGCPIQVPPAQWGCGKHWYKLPVKLRDRIWKAYRPGQEKDMRPSTDYINAANDIQDWIRENG